MNRATAIAPANIAFTKFWGWRDEALTLPFHDTVSMTLSACTTRTTVIESGGDEIVLLDASGRERPAGESFRRRVSAHLDFLRGLASPGGGGAAPVGRGPGLRVVTRNAMPMGTGIASSASGFAALTVAGCAVLGIGNVDERTLSILARRSGSGSASRSIPGGFVRWHAGARADGADSFSESLHAPDHWALADTIAVVATEPKQVASREGHRAAPTSPLFAARLAAMEGRNRRVIAALAARDLDALGPLLEIEALELHRIAETSAEPARYRNAATDLVLERVARLREEGVGVWFTLDAGPNVHLMSLADDVPRIERALHGIAAVVAVHVNLAAPGARLVEDHLA